MGGWKDVDEWVGGRMWMRKDVDEWKDVDKWLRGKMWMSGQGGGRMWMRP